MTEIFLPFFLGKTIEEAEKVYKDNEKLLNTIVNKYYQITDIDKADLFGEAIIGLARAQRDFDCERSKNFKTFAVYKIKDSLNIYIRKAQFVIKIPSYLKKTALIINRIKILLSSNNISEEDIYIVINDGTTKNIQDRTSFTVQKKCDELLTFIFNTAQRACISYDELITRIELIPTDVDFDAEEIIYNTEENKILSQIALKTLKNKLPEDEQEIINLLIEGATFKEIGIAYKKSSSWAHKKATNIIKKIIRLSEDGDK